MTKITAKYVSIDINFSPNQLCEGMLPPINTFTPFCVPIPSAMEARIPFQQAPEPTEKPTLFQSVLRKSKKFAKDLQNDVR